MRRVFIENLLKGRDCVHSAFGLFDLFPIQERLMAANKESGATSSTAKDWIKKIDQSSIADLRKQYPKAIWLVGGIVLLSLIL